VPEAAPHAPPAPPTAADPPAPSPPAGGRDISPVGLAHLGVLYFAWSTTYLAIRIAVREGSGFPPFFMSGSRLLAAGPILLLIALALGRSLRVSRRDWGTIVAAGLLLWIGGNGLVTWAEQFAESAYAALLIGAMPIWTSVIEALLDRTWPSPRLAMALLIGFAGVAVLTIPELRAAEGSDLLAVLALLVAPISWGAGAVLQSRRKISAAPLASAGFQQVVGGAAFLLIALAVGEPTPNPTPAAWGGWAYLVLVGGLAFLSFTEGLRLLPTRIVMTYAYVNPVGAALLGWWLLDESITWWTAAGAVLVIAGVAGVFRERYGQG
jgi:drug/metabolite transporter (DMT)-like permease